jgi:cation transport protein ChaC
MTAAEDPFRHHPGLRELITPAGESFFRHFRPADIDAVLARHGLPADWRYTDAEIDARREAFMADHSGDLSVFG